ncbi:hypothetical protein [Roseomonas sp. BN140053]|uniref:hypothetical protein n=1 Tax=Roseomonas sp. BN140053 TaxID=3391898 RepID=UPI0039EAE3C0
MATKVQEHPADQHEAMWEQLQALVTEVATWRLIGSDGTKLAREVLQQLRQHIEDHLSKATGMPSLAAQPGWDDCTEFLRYAVRAIEAHRIGPFQEP